MECFTFSLYFNSYCDILKKKSIRMFSDVLKPSITVTIVCLISSFTLFFVFYTCFNAFNFFLYLFHSSFYNIFILSNLFHLSRPCFHLAVWHFCCFHFSTFLILFSYLFHIISVLLHHSCHVHVCVLHCRHFDCFTTFSLPFSCCYMLYKIFITGFVAIFILLLVKILHHLHIFWLW